MRTKKRKQGTKGLTLKKKPGASDGEPNNAQSPSLAYLCLHVKYSNDVRRGGRCVDMRRMEICMPMGERGREIEYDGCGRKSLAF